MRLNGFFGNGPQSGDDTQRERDLEAYNRNRMQMTVATSTFAGIALVGMFCSCLWFVCCRNSSSKTRKKGRTWVTNEDTGRHNPYSYDGYLDSQGYIMQMNQTGESGDGGVAPYISNPLYHPNSLYPNDMGIPNAYEFTDHFDYNHASKGERVLQGDGGIKDFPPSYTALFFAASDPAMGIGGNGETKGDHSNMTNTDPPRVTNIKPIHLKVTSSIQDQQKVEQAPYNDFDDSDDDSFMGEYAKKDSSTAPPESLVSVESDPEKEATGDKNEKKSGLEKKSENEKQAPKKSVYAHLEEATRASVETPPPYNPGFTGYSRF